MEAPPLDLFKVLCVKQLSASDAANSKQIKLPKSDARKFVGELRHKQSSSVEVVDSQGSAWTFLCTCYGCQYALSRVGNFCAAYNLKPGQFMVFYIDTSNKLRVSIMKSVPEEWLQKDTRKSPPQATKPPKPKPQAAMHRAAPFMRQYPHAMPPFFPADLTYAYQQRLSAAGAGQLHNPMDLLSSFMHDKQAVAAGLASQRSSFSQLPGYHHGAMPMYAGKTHGMPPPVDTPATKKPRLGEHTISGSLDSDSTSQHWDGTTVIDAQHSEVNSTQLARRLTQMLPPMAHPSARAHVLPGMPLPNLPGADALKGMLSKAWPGARPQAESPTSEESNQEFHMHHSSLHHDLAGRTPASSNRSSREGSPVAGEGCVPGVLLTKPLSKMDVACAHDPIGIVFGADKVLASGLLRGSSQEICFVLKDTSGGSHPCKLSASRNRKFCYLSGLGCFLQQEGAAAGDTVAIGLASSGRLMVSLAPQPELLPEQQALPAPVAEVAAVQPPVAVQ